MSDRNPSALVAVGLVMPLLGIATMGLRFYTRRKMRNQILVDDWLLIPALSFRSTFSLHSRASQTASRSKNSESKTALSGGSSEHFEQEHSTLETYAIREDKFEIGKGRVPDGKILVQSSIGRVEDWA
ncbi:MAG: hypothetical protein Q9213_004892 [Squamulea squamosa]